MKELNMKTYVENPAIIQLSHKYNQMDCIESLDVDLCDHIYHVHALVRVFDQQTACEIEFNEEGELLHYECSCQWCTPKEPCAHIMASLFKLYQLDISDFPFHYVNEKFIHIQQKKEKREKEYRYKNAFELTQISRALLQQQKQRYDVYMALLLQDPGCHLEPHIFMNDKKIPLLEYRIGYDTKYIIKDLDAFLERIDQQELFVYGKLLSFVHDREAFDLFSQQQIHFLQDMQAYMHKQNDCHLGRFIELKGEMLDVLFDLYVNTDFSSFKMKKSHRKPLFHLEVNGQVVTLAIMSQENWICGKKHLYHIYDKKGICYVERYQGDEQGVLVSLIKNMAFKTISIFIEEMPDFSKYVFSIIQDYIEMDRPCEFMYDNHLVLYGDVNEVQGISCWWKSFNDQKHLGFHQDVVENYLKKYASYIDENKHCAYFQKESEKTDVFMREGLLFLKEHCQMNLSEAFLKMAKEVYGYDSVSDI